MNNMNAIDFSGSNFQPSAEVNSLQKNVNTKTRGVEIFSALCGGKDVSKYGTDVDKVNTYMKARGEAALNGDPKAQAEINAIQTEMIETPLLKRLEILDFMGETINVGYNDVLQYRVYNIEGKMSNWQASSATFPFATYSFTTRPMETQTITGGTFVNHREIANGDWDAVGVLNEQVVTDMTNKVFAKVQHDLYYGIKDAKDAGMITNFAETDGINKTAVDAVLKIAKRWGNVTITGDYSVISQLEDCAGFTVNTAGSVMFSEAVMEEIRRTGLLNTYKGCPVVEIPNTYDVTKLNADGDYFATYMPEGLLYFLISGALSPLKIGFRGGLESMSGQDINLRADVTRYDMEVGTAIIGEYIPELGLLSDTNYTVD